MIASPRLNVTFICTSPLLIILENVRVLSFSLTNMASRFLMRVRRIGNFIAGQAVYLLQRTLPVRNRNIFFELIMLFSLRFHSPILNQNWGHFLYVTRNWSRDWRQMDVGKRTLYSILRVQPTRGDVSQFIYFCKTLYMFQTVFPSHHQELKTAHTASGVCQTVTATWRCMCSFELLMMDEKTVKHVQRLTEINKLWNVASCWLYFANVLAMRGPLNVKTDLVVFKE